MMIMKVAANARHKAIENTNNTIVLKPTARNTVCIGRPTLHLLPSRQLTFSRFICSEKAVLFESFFFLLAQEEKKGF